ncbi:MAG: SDR family oxidoreductase [Hyphomicrobiaceae bacterium]|nr:SDR family oxidoreductase [Hyphomicrobiaceae bacterium]
MSETRVALVTGANRGIGLEIVRQLARNGIIAAIGSRDPAKGQAAADSLLAEGLEVPVVVVDVADDASCRAAVAELDRMVGRIDILVNNAGIMDDGNESILTVSPDVLRRTFDVNTIGALTLTQAVVPVMQRNGYGRIVNMSSMLGQLDDMQGGRPAYRMSKTAMNALTRVAAAELAALNIKVNAMSPGWVRTEMGGPDAPRPVEKGAETAVWLAMLGDDGPTGGFFEDMKPIAW